ncbi:MAG TPA: hypothetical protein VNJ29_00375 [Candidatus Nitrosotenuis sp.]|nr:hypothetical protein [Candidatus Nitrosotenuis sp.]
MKIIVNRSINIAMILFLLMVIGFSSQAQESKVFAMKGINEIGGSFSYQYQSHIDKGKEYLNINVLSFLPYVSYFVSDNLQIGINPLGINRFWRKGSSSTQYLIFLAPAYNFNTVSGIYPFVEPQIGYNWITYSNSFYPSDSKGFCWGTRAGVKVPITGNGLLNIALQYQETTQNTVTETSRHGSNIFMFSAGFTFWY